MEDLYYNVGNKKIALSLSTSKYATRIAPKDISKPMLAGALPDLASDFASAGATKLEEGLYLFFDTPENKPATLNIFDAGIPEISNVPVYEGPGNELLIPKGEILIKLRPDADKHLQDFLKAQYNFESVTINQYNPALINARLVNDASTLEVANDIAENVQGVEYAEPNFIRIGPAGASLTNDPLSDKQWALQNRGQTSGVSGADINIETAWSITKGNFEIIVAVLDEGVDYAHPELNVNLELGSTATVPKLVAGFDSWENGAGDSPDPEPGDNHGTACAGIIGAAGNNEIGISGIAPGCRIMGLRIAKRVPGSHNWIFRDSEAIHDAIYYASKQGVHILSNSWGGGGESSPINEAISEATTNGRGGLGCIAVFAAGNSQGPVSYPAYRPDVIAVGASNQWDQVKTKDSNDGEYWWGSNYGAEVFVCAPGVQITTTDNSGVGAGVGSGAFMYQFNGTSAATPHVAATIALMLSVNKELKIDDIREIFRQTSKQIDGIQGAHSSYSGWGRIDAGKAVWAAATRGQHAVAINESADVASVMQDE